MKKNKTRLNLKHAEIKDIKFTHQLFNQNILEKNFFSRKKVNLKNHEIWFKKRIKQKKFYIGWLRKRVGYIRFDEINKKNLSVSIAIDKKYKRKGYGKKMLLKTLNNEEISKFNVLAKIRQDNLTSRKFFLNSGFKFFKNNFYIFKSKKKEDKNIKK